MRVSDLYQQTSWMSGDGETIRLEDMATGHRVNLVRWLERRAERLQEAELWEFAGAPDDVWSPDYYDEDPIKWLHDTPLVRRLDELIAADTAPRARTWLRNRTSYHLRRALGARS